MKVFISHSNVDQAAALRLATALSASGFEVWNDTQDILPGDNWADKIGKALETSDAMVVLVSPESMSSQWVRREIEYALGSRNYSDRVIAIELRPTKDIPWILRQLQFIKSSPKSIVSAAPKVIEALKQTA